MANVNFSRDSRTQGTPFTPSHRLNLEETLKKIYWDFHGVLKSFLGVFFQPQNVISYYLATLGKHRAFKKAPTFRVTLTEKALGMVVPVAYRSWCIKFVFLPVVPVKFVYRGTLSPWLQRLVQVNC